MNKIQDFNFTQVFLIIDIYIFIVSAISNCLKQPVLVTASYDNSSCLPKSARNTRHKTYLMFLPHSTHGVCVMQFQVNDRKKRRQSISMNSTNCCTCCSLDQSETVSVCSVCVWCLRCGLHPLLPLHLSSSC